MDRPLLWFAFVWNEVIEAADVPCQVTDHHYRAVGKWREESQCTLKQQPRHHTHIRLSSGLTGWS